MPACRSDIRMVDILVNSSFEKTNSRWYSPESDSNPSKLNSLCQNFLDINMCLSYGSLTPSKTPPALKLRGLCLAIGLGFTLVQQITKGCINVAISGCAFCEQTCLLPCPVPLESSRIIWCGLHSSRRCISAMACHHILSSI